MISSNFLGASSGKRYVFPAHPATNRGYWTQPLPSTPLLPAAHHSIPIPCSHFSPIFTRASRNRKETGYYYHTEQEKLHHTRLHIIRCPIKIQQRRNHVSPPLFAIFLILIFTLLFVNRFQHEIFFFLLLNSHLSLI